jgi:hypothetical protein
MRFSLKTVGADVRSRDRTYSPSWLNGRTVRRDSMDIRPWAKMYSQSITGKPYFHQLSHSSCLLVIELCFNRNRTDDKSFLNIRGYGASRELHRGVLRPRWVQTHINALLLLFLHCTYFVYIKHACVCNSHEIYFGTMGNSFLWKCVSVNKIIMRLVKLCM